MQLLSAKFTPQAQDLPERPCAQSSRLPQLPAATPGFQTTRRSPQFSYRWCPYRRLWRGSGAKTGLHKRRCTNVCSGPRVRTSTRQTVRVYWRWSKPSALTGSKHGTISPKPHHWPLESQALARALQVGPGLILLEAASFLPALVLEHVPSRLPEGSLFWLFKTSRQFLLKSSPLYRKHQ